MEHRKSEVKIRKDRRINSKSNSAVSTGQLNIDNMMQKGNLKMLGNEKHKRTKFGLKGVQNLESMI